MADAAGTSALLDLRAAFDVLNGAAPKQKTARNLASSLLTWEDPRRCLLRLRLEVDDLERALLAPPPTAASWTAGTAAAAAMAAPELKSCLDALLVSHGRSPGNGGGGLDTMLWKRQVDQSSVISRDMGHLAAMAPTTASAKDASAPGAADDRAGSVIVGGGDGNVVYKLYREGIIVVNGGGNMGAALSGSATPKRHSPSIIF